MEIDLLTRVWEIGLLERVVQETSEPSQHKGEIFLSMYAAQVVNEEITRHGWLRGDAN